MLARLIFLLMFLVQGQRFHHHVPFLSLDERLCAVAQARVEDMVARDYFSHYTPEGAMVFDLFSPRERRDHYIGELLARNNSGSPAEKALAGFIGSPEHRDILLRPQYEAIGVGIGEDSQGITYFVIVLMGKGKKYG